MLSSKSVFAPAVSSAVTRWRRVIGRDVASVGSLRFEPGAAGARAVEAAVLILLWFLARALGWSLKAVFAGELTICDPLIHADKKTSRRALQPTKALRAALHSL